MKLKGLTPVVAIVVLTMITVAASGVAYLSTQGTLNKAKDADIELTKTLDQTSVVSCYRQKSSTNLLIKNNGDKAVNISKMDVFYRGEELESTTDKGIIGEGQEGVVKMTRVIERSESLKMALGEAVRTHTCDALPKKSCPEGMAYIYNPDGDNFCIFKHEAAREDATSNSRGSSNIPVSRKGVATWHSLSRSQAQNACQNAGYRLPTNKEWQEATKAEEGEPDTWVHGNNQGGTLSAVEDSSEQCKQDPTNPSKDRCLTGTGPDTWETKDNVEDLNGNLEEIVGTQRGEGGATSANVPSSSGTITDWNHTAEVPNSTDSSDGSASDFGSDSFGTNGQTIFRGGDWSHGSSAGPWRMRFTRTNDNGPDIGFRCATSPSDQY